MKKEDKFKKISTGVVIAFCLLQIFACSRQEPWEGGVVGGALNGALSDNICQLQIYMYGRQLPKERPIVGRILYGILSGKVSESEHIKFLADNEILKEFTEKVREQKKEEERLADSDGSMAQAGEEERVFDAYEVEEKEYLLFEDDPHIHAAIRYPQLHGFTDAQKEKKVNQLIESEAKRLIPYDLAEDLLSDPEFMEEYPDFIVGVYQLYEIKYLNENMISIFYESLRGRVDSGYYPHYAVMATTIDLEEVKIVELTDIITDMEEVCTLLWEDQFENISIWDGMVSTRKISEDFWEKEELLEALLGTHEYKVIEWYTGGSNLVIVATEWYFQEYSMEISLYPELVDENFREKLLEE